MAKKRVAKSSRLTVGADLWLRLGGHSALVSKAGTARLALRLSARALRALRGGGALRLHAALSFVPATGPVWREVVTIGFRPRGGRSGRFNAVLLRAG